MAASDSQLSSPLSMGVHVNKCYFEYIFNANSTFFFIVFQFFQKKNSYIFYLKIYIFFNFKIFRIDLQKKGKEKKIVSQPGFELAKSKFAVF